jgi:hypothetical protein
MKHLVPKHIMIIGIFIILSACRPSAEEAAIAERKDAPADMPIVVVNISRTSTIEIQSTTLNQDLIYSAIPVDNDTVLRGQPAIDSENYLYIPYGNQDNYFARLGPDGSVTTIEIDTDWDYDSQWVGDKFLIIPQSSNEMYLIDLDLTMETVPNSLAYLDDEYKVGYLGLSNTSPGEAIWSFSTPLRNDDGDFALYRTFNIDTGEMSEFQMEVPATSKDYLPNPENEDEKMGLIVYGIDNANQNALICYAMFPNSAFQTTLELYDGDTGATITKEVRCCLNNNFNLEGEAIVEDSAFESCCVPGVRNWIDYEPTFSYASLLRLDDGENISFIPFSDAWLIATETRVIVVDTQNHDYPSYDLPDEIKHQIYYPARPISN